MSQALYTSKTGIAAGQTQIDVIANNVANINTTAYKTANVTFSTLFSKTLSSGTAGTTKGGGINPRQVGLGTQVASISRDFGHGSFQQTGVSSDLMISGNGYFVVQDGSGNQYFTRDGHFSLDSEGNLCTASGMRVCGTINEYSTVSSRSTVIVPTMLNVSLTGTEASKIGNKTLGELNAVSINTGTFKINVGGTSSSVDAANFEKDGAKYYLWPDSTHTGTKLATYEKLDMSTLSTDDRARLTELYGTISPTDTYYKGLKEGASSPPKDSDITYIKGDIPTSGTVAIRNPQLSVSYKITDADMNTNLNDFVTSVNAEFNTQGYSSIKFKVIDGGLQLDNGSGKQISVSDDQSTNFLVQTGLADAIESASEGQTTFYTTDMNQSAVIGNSFNSATAIKRSDWTISESGIVTASYNDGSNLTVFVDSSGRGTWRYTTADNVVITGSGTSGSDLDLSSTGLDPANMVLQLGTVVNDGGLISEVDNLWTIGPNAGEFAYGMSNGNGFGSLKNGGLEGSNVDMATELSNMITAQRAIQVNSRVFSTASSILETLAYLGQ